MTSASSGSRVGRMPCCMSWPAMRWLSSSFIWQPQVSMKKRRGGVIARLGGRRRGLDAVGLDHRRLDRLRAAPALSPCRLSSAGSSSVPSSQPARQGAGGPPLLQELGELLLGGLDVEPRLAQAVEHPVPVRLDLGVAHEGVVLGVELLAQLGGLLLQLLDLVGRLAPAARGCSRARPRQYCSSRASARRPRPAAPPASPSSCLLRIGDGDLPLGGVLGQVLVVDHRRSLAGAGAPLPARPGRPRPGSPAPCVVRPRRGRPRPARRPPGSSRGAATSTGARSRARGQCGAAAGAGGSLGALRSLAGAPAGAWCRGIPRCRA